MKKPNIYKFYEYLSYKKNINNILYNYDSFINENFKFKLNDRFDDIINNINNKKHAKIIGSLLIKELLNEYANIETVKPKLPQNFNVLDTQKKLDALLPLMSPAAIRSYISKLTSIIDYVRTNNITANTFTDLYDKSVEWHNEIVNNTENIQSSTKVERLDETPNTDKFITYENGWYWINLKESYSKDEADNMGHCGNDSGRILFSLRDENSNSHITASYEVLQKALCQCKGRGNTKPKDIYHKYIMDMLLNEKYPINIIVTGGYKPQLDFNLLDLTEDERDFLIEKKPSLEYTDNMFELYLKDEMYDKMCPMLQNGFVYNGDMKYHDISLLRYADKQKMDIKLIQNSDWYSTILNTKTTKEDMEFFVKFYEFSSKPDVSTEVIVTYMLWKYKYISNADTEAKIKDLKIEDDKWYIKNVDIKDTAFMFSTSEKSRGGSSCHDYVEGIDDFEGGYINYSLRDISIDDVSMETKEMIFKKIEDDDIEFEEDDIDELLDGEEDKFSFSSFSDYTYELLKTDILNDKRNELLRDLLQLDSMSDIKDCVVHGFDEAQEGADYSELYDTVEKELLSFFKSKSISKLEFDPYWAVLVSKCDVYSVSLLHTLEKVFSYRDDAESYGLEEDDFPELLSFNIPYGGFNGSPTDAYLNETIQHRLQM